MINKLLVFCLIIGSLSSCIESQNKFSKIPPGLWRGVLYLNPSAQVIGLNNKEVTTNPDNSEQLPFNFEVVYDTPDDFHIVLHNGDERIKVDDILYGRDRTTAKDTLQIQFLEYDTRISAVYEEKIMEGHWYLNYKDNYKVKFKAIHGDTMRFDKGITTPDIDVTGRWDVVFENGTKTEYPAIGIFDQSGEYLEGTFQTETGDYRYLEGKVAGEKLFLSCFDGAHAFLFEAKDLGDGKLNGVFKSEISYTAPFIATKNADASIGDPFALNQATESSKPMTLSFPNTEGKIITLEDPQYQGKAKIIDIMGTWCPNCKDASNFLKEFKNTPESRNVEIIGLAFERYKDEAKNLAQIKKYKQKSETPWEILLGGYYAKSEASKALPQIDKILSYPTMIFLDKDNMIQHIHTGFSGPATQDYEDFKIKFNQIINTL